jgi:hypothetical protein
MAGPKQENRVGADAAVSASFFRRAEGRLFALIWSRSKLFLSDFVFGGFC